MIDDDDAILLLLLLAAVVVVLLLLLVGPTTLLLPDLDTVLDALHMVRIVLICVYVMMFLLCR